MPIPNSNSDEMLRDLLALSHVPRWTTHPVTRPQSVAEHAYRVAIIGHAITIRIQWPDEAALWRVLRDVIWWGMVHDGPEAKTGDIPAPLKQVLGGQLQTIEAQACPWYERPNETTPEYIIIQIADTLEALSWLKRYGHALKDRFDGEAIEDKLSRRMWNLAQEHEARVPGLQLALQHVSRLVLP